MVAAWPGVPCVASAWRSGADLSSPAIPALSCATIAGSGVSDEFSLPWCDTNALFTF
jgi:hypothetical protein